MKGIIDVTVSNFCKTAKIGPIFGQTFRRETLMIEELKCYQ